MAGHDILSGMAPKHILPVVGVIFLLLAVARLARDGGRLGPASRTWLIVAGLFGLVSLWLWFN